MQREERHRLFRWEFLPWRLFYIPVAFYWLWLSARARSLVFFSAANPKMKMGGFVGNSKWDSLKNFSSEYIPRTAFIENKISPGRVMELALSNSISFPFILKPDAGERGWQVEKVGNEAELKDYLSRASYPLLLQEFIDLPAELGVLYFRYPGEEKGIINSVVMKKLLSVRGDGRSTLLRLIKRSYRARRQLKELQKKYFSQINDVIEDGKEMELVPVGNHCRGTMFLNGNYLINEKLVDVFDRLAKQQPEFYFGRFDIRVRSIGDLYEGRNIKILELNGANAEPNHIYDPDMPILHAYRDLFRHWKMLFRISVMNHKRGYPYVRLAEAIKITRDHFKKKKQ